MSEPRAHIAWQPIAAAIGLALAVHAGLLLTDVLPAMLDAWAALFPQPAVEEPTEVEMISMTPQQFEQNRLLQEELPEIEPPPEPLPAPEPPPPRPQGQVVDVAPTPDDTPPLEARFLSEHNTRVKEEMVSPDPDPDYAKPKPQKTVAEAEPRPKAERPEPEPVEPPPDPAPAEKPPEPDQEAVDPVEPPEDEGVEGGADALAQAPEQDPGQPQLETEDGDRAPKPEGEPAPPAAEDAREVAMAGDAAASDEAGAPAPDAIRGVKTGPATFLNTREFMYATFFNRVKRLVGQSWHPAVRDTLDRHDIIGRGPARDELITLVHVRMAPDGALESVKLVHSSGMAVFDDLALKAFHEAAPFPNPPQGLVGPDGRISFNFGFTISQRFGPTTHAFRPRHMR